MIVICTKCHAKFRMADERVGPRGAKVRCSKCKAVFLVSRHEPEPQRPPPLPPPLPVRGSAPGAGEPRAGGAAPAGDPFAAGAADPFAAPAQDPFAPSAAAADPFRRAGFTPLPPPSADPFAGAADPFAPAGAVDPFDAPATDERPGGEPYVGAARLPVTDLADLLGPATPPAFAAPGGLAASPDPGGGVPLEAGLDGLALEDRTTPAPSPLQRGSEGGGVLGELPEPGSAGLDPAPLDPAAFDFSGVGDEALSLAGEPEVGPVPAMASPLDAVAIAREGEPSPPPAARARDGAPRPAAEAPAAAAPGGRIPGARGSRLRAAAVNAVALAALLLAALAFLVVWRSEGPLDASAFRPLSIARALRTGGAPGPFTAQSIRSGLYERERGPPFLFVRGDVVSRAPAPVAAVQVEVEVVREGRVIARGAARAGAVPTPEELHRARDAAALAALARAAAARAPAEVRPGDVVPFLVAIGDHPADLSGASLRVALAGSEALVR